MTKICYKGNRLKWTLIISQNTKSLAIYQKCSLFKLQLTPMLSSSEGEHRLRNFLLQGTVVWITLDAWIFSRGIYFTNSWLQVFKICNSASWATQPLVSGKLCAAIIWLWVKGNVAQSNWPYDLFGVVYPTTQFYNKQTCILRNTFQL